MLGWGHEYVSKHDVKQSGAKQSNANLAERTHTITRQVNQRKGKRSIHTPLRLLKESKKKDEI